MINKSASLYCMLTCLLLSVYACTKNTNETPVTSVKNGVDGRLLSGSADLNASSFAPGDSLIVRGDTSKGDETALLHSGYGGITTPNFPSFTALGQGFGGIDGHDRSIIKFKLRHISDSLRNNPPQIQKALLYLYQYHRPADRNPYTISQDADNRVELHRVVGKWDYSTMVWNNQPALAKGSINLSEDIVIIPAIKTPLAKGTHDNQVVDVTDMVRKIISTRNNQGFLLKLPDENDYCGRAYGSMACPYVNKRPKLVLYF